MDTNLLSREIEELVTRSEIEALAIRYSDAADTIGRGDVEAGRQIIKSCFTDDSVFEAFFPTDAADAPFFSSIGADGWTDAVAKAFAAGGYTGTHHQIGNIQVSVQGETTIMKVYVTATHVLDWRSSLFVATAVYTDHVVRTPQGWRFGRRSVRATSGLNVVGASPPLP
ncbi:nuclear transport factor 2 family protein [Sorangium sp. So ce1128]